MADQKLSELTELAATPASDDEVYIRDVSELASAESKRITIANLMDAAARTATLIVAANDSTAKGKAGADYVCDGTADDVQIQAAIDALPAIGGKVLLLGGSYYISTPILLDAYTHIEGMYAVRGFIGFSAPIAYLYLNDAVDDSIIKMRTPGTPVAGVSLKNLLIKGNHAGQTAAISSDKYLVDLLGSWDGVVENVSIEGSHDSGVRLDNCGHISNSMVRGSQRRGIYMAVDSQVISCMLSSNAQDVSSHYCQDADIYAGEGSSLIMANEIFNSNYSSGIYLGGVAVRCFGNRIDDIYYHGIVCRATGCTIAMNHVQDPGLVSGVGTGIVLESGADKNMVAYNIINDVGPGGFGNADYGIRDNSTSKDNDIFANTLLGTYITAAISYASPGRVRDNRGYITENSGTATVLNTATSIVVAHGLASTPTRVLITPKENPTNAVSFWWVDTAGATNFTINVNADPGASNLDFDWHAQVGEG